MSHGHPPQPYIPSPPPPEIPESQRRDRQGLFSRRGLVIMTVGLMVVGAGIGGVWGAIALGLLTPVFTIAAVSRRYITRPLRHAASTGIKKAVLNPDRFPQYADQQVDTPGAPSVPTPQGDQNGPRTYPLRDPVAQGYLTWLNQAYRSPDMAGVEHVVKMAKFQPPGRAQSPQAKALMGVLLELDGMASIEDVRAHLNQRLAPLDEAARNLAPPAQPTRPTRPAPGRGRSGYTPAPGAQEFYVGPDAGGLGTQAGLDIA